MGGLVQHGGKAIKAGANAPEDPGKTLGHGGQCCRRAHGHEAGHERVFNQVLPPGVSSENEGRSNPTA